MREKWVHLEMLPGSREEFRANKFYEAVLTLNFEAKFLTASFLRFRQPWWNFSLGSVGAYWWSELSRDNVCSKGI